MSVRRRDPPGLPEVRSDLPNVKLLGAEGKDDSET